MKPHEFEKYEKEIDLARRGQNPLSLLTLTNKDIDYGYLKFSRLY